METMDDANPKLFPANEPEEHELYTIPSYSSWFSWNEIHEKEKISLKEFFQGNSISKTPKIYKEYRDFIINKYREDPLRRLNFTEIRKSLIGDVNLIYKVFVFLDKWGLINFGAPKVIDSLTVLSQDEDKQRVVFEEGAPNGVKVVEIPNSSKVVTLPPQISVSCDRGGDVVENGFRLPPLASYSDVFRDLLRQSCAKCGEYGDFKRLQSSSNKKESIVTCSRCLKSEKNEEDKVVDNLKSKDSKAGSDNHEADSWTDAETLLLLEYVQSHGDDWDRVAENVRTKSKIECIAKLIQLPFGELMLSTTNGKGAGRNIDNNSICITDDQSTSLEPQKPIEKTDLLYKQINESEPEQTDSGQTEGRPQKRRCMDSFADSSDSLMKQVAHLSTLVSPHVAAAAVDAAITALCQENPYARMFLESEGDDIMNVFGSHTHSNKPTRLLGVVDSEMVDSHTESVRCLVANIGLVRTSYFVAVFMYVSQLCANMDISKNISEVEVILLVSYCQALQLNKDARKDYRGEEEEEVDYEWVTALDQKKETIQNSRVEDILCNMRSLVFLRRFFFRGIQSKAVSCFASLMNFMEMGGRPKAIDKSDGDIMVTSETETLKV
ncbi:SWI/SNF complex subunit SWI3A [Thalictrum thalictroides]|uniref:SWI/SNF complex subunit SWI3A n=1 Tax=Thalictrum thalictroides TaxID=46969 RepID=A0A7J6VQK3_THATH|nr:SWI/SNF complex subunit SWI3A [Thalictrum thalictroides]